MNREALTHPYFVSYEESQPQMVPPEYHGNSKNRSIFGPFDYITKTSTPARIQWLWGEGISQRFRCRKNRLVLALKVRPEMQNRWSEDWCRLHTCHFKAAISNTNSTKPAGLQICSNDTASSSNPEVCTAARVNSPLN